MLCRRFFYCIIFAVRSRAQEGMAAQRAQRLQNDGNGRSTGMLNPAELPPAAAACRGWQPVGNRAVSEYLVQNTVFFSPFNCVMDLLLYYSSTVLRRENRTLPHTAPAPIENAEIRRWKKSTQEDDRKEKLQDKAGRMLHVKILVQSRTMDSNWSNTLVNSYQRTQVK